MFGLLNVPLFLENQKMTRKLRLTFSGIVILAVLMNVGLYHPGVGNEMVRLLRYFPEPVLDILGINGQDVSLTGVLGNTLYGFWFLLLPLLYNICLTRDILIKPMESGSLIYAISALGERKKVIFTKGYFLCFSLFVLIAVGAAAGMVSSALFFPGELEIPQFLLLNMGVFCLQFFLSGLMFVTASLNLKKKNWTRLGMNISVVFFLFCLLGRTEGLLGGAKYLTVFSLFDVSSIMEGELLSLLSLILLLVFGAALYGMGIFVFQQQDFIFTRETMAKGM